jgi:hypothetical protein
MIVIDKLCGGRFGNKILHYNNLAQIGKYLEIDYTSVSYEPYSKLNLLNDYKGGYNLEINANVIKKLSKENFKDFYNERYGGKIVNLLPCLGELFFYFDHNTREIFNVPEPNYKLDTNTKNIGIHFRGTDFHTWNPESILDREYYINCIEDTLDTNTKYYLFTDDKKLKSFKEIINYLTEKDINFELGYTTKNGGDFIHDFLQLCQTDIIISSPSTFAICAGIMGKEKECFHSKKWVESRKRVNDKFWVDLTRNINNNYILKKIL